MGVYDRFFALSTRLIEKYGEKVVWQVNVSDPPVDPDKPWKRGANQQTEFQPFIIFLPDTYDRRETFKPVRFEDTPIESVVGFMGPQSFTPTLVDSISRGTGEKKKLYRIDSINLVGPNSEGTILYKLRIKN